MTALDGLLARHQPPWSTFAFDRRDLDRGWQVIDAGCAVVAGEMPYETALALTALPDREALLGDLIDALGNLMAVAEITPAGEDPGTRLWAELQFAGEVLGRALTRYEARGEKERTA